MSLRVAVRSTVVAVLTTSGLWALTPAAQAAHVIVVPTAYRTIQAAVDAAHAGDSIRVLPGTYREQVSVAKDLTITGSGAGSTTILAPKTFTAGEDGNNSIVEVRDAASLALSRISVRGPGSGSCDSGALEAGIRVIGGAHADVSWTRVEHIHNALAAPCAHSGIGVMVGDLTDPESGSVVLRDSEVSDYISKGVVVLSAGPATVTRNVVVGPSQVSSDGIDVLFADGVVSDNVVSGNECRPTDAACGQDFFAEYQHAGIFAGGASTEVTRNVLAGNQVGIYALFGATLDRNVLLANDYVGIAAEDGAFSLDHDVIRGGALGVAVIASSVDTHATLTRVDIARTSGAPVQTFTQDGFAATYTR